jgi:hypothetical protein
MKAHTEWAQAWPVDGASGVDYPRLEEPVLILRRVRAAWGLADDVIRALVGHKQPVAAVRFLRLGSPDDYQDLMRNNAL